MIHAFVEGHMSIFDALPITLLQVVPLSSTTTLTQGINFESSLSKFTLSDHLLSEFTSSTFTDGMTINSPHTEVPLFF